MFLMQVKTEGEDILDQKINPAFRQLGFKVARKVKQRCPLNKCFRARKSWKVRDSAIAYT